MPKVIFTILFVLSNKRQIDETIIAYGIGNYLSWIGNSLLKPIHKQITPQNITCRPESNIRCICLNPTDNWGDNEDYCFS